MKLSKNAKLRLLGLPIGLAAGVLALVLQVSGLFDRFELASLDSRYRIRGPVPLSDEILVVTLDEAAMKLLGWPLPRTAWAALIDTAFEHGAKVVGFDILFADPGKDKGGDNLLARLALTNKKVIFPAQFVFRAQEGENKPGLDSYLRNSPHVDSLGPHFPRASAMIAPLPILSDASCAPAHLQLDSSPDGVFRKVPLFIEYQAHAVPALALQLACVYKGVDCRRVTLSSNYLTIEGLGAIPIEEQKNGEAVSYVYFKTMSEGINSVFISDLLRARAEQESGGKVSLDLDKLFRGKIVLVGQSAGSIGDHGPTPFSSISPLVLVHANIVDNLINGVFLQRPGHLVNWLIIFILCMVITLLIVYLRMVPAVILSLLTLFAFDATCQALFSYGDTWLNIISPMFAAILSMVLVGTYGHFVRDADERILKRAFSTYLAPGVMERIIENPEQLNLLGQTKRISILFSDIKGYTNLSNQLEATEVLDILRQYMDAMTRILFKHSATVDKIMGDGIMAFFGDPLPMPDHAKKAVLAAMEMQKELLLLQKSWRSKGLEGLMIRIGIATGEVYVGNIGSSYHVEYTALGRAVNLASRLETAAVPGGILISEETRNEVMDYFDLQQVPGLSLKGYDEKICAYLVVGEKKHANDG